MVFRQMYLNQRVLRDMIWHIAMMPEKSVIVLVKMYRKKRILSNTDLIHILITDIKVCALYLTIFHIASRQNIKWMNMDSMKNRRI